MVANPRHLEQTSDIGAIDWRSVLRHVAVSRALDDLEEFTLLKDRKITLEMTPEARRAIFKAGYDRAYGARPLKRAIQRMVQDKLAVKILDGSVLHGDHVLVTANGAGLDFVVLDREPVAV